MIRRTPVLIHGETGTGKELIAKAIALAEPGHWDESSRAWKPCPYEPIHLGSIPKDLVQDALFGHEPGAFSGAKTSQAGVLERCHGGTVFLDEVAELPHQTQVALLRCLQEGVVRRLGSSKLKPAAPRLISATHVDLGEAVLDGRFRPDVLQRLRSVQITIPPLRSRIEDLDELVERLIQIEEVDVVVGAGLREDVREFLQGSAAGYDWPGNVRELAACVRSLGLGIRPQLRFDPDGAARRGARSPRRVVPQPPEGFERLEASLDDVKRWYAAAVFDASSSQVQAAKRLGIARATLRGLLANGSR